jgi:hypothetical protein
VAARNISVDHRLSIREETKEAGKRKREEMIWGTKYSGAGGATPGRWALRNRNVMQSNEEGGLQNNNGTASQISGRCETPVSIMP